MTLPPLLPLRAHNPLLLDNAVKGYEWFKTHDFTNAQGLIVDGFHISANQTTCDQRNEMVYTYNQGEHQVFSSTETSIDYADILAKPLCFPA